MKNKLCIITNIGPHYRYPIFSLIDRTIGCDFYIGDKVASPIKKFDYRLLDGYQKTLRNLFFHQFYWQFGSIAPVFKPYKYYILDGEPYCVSSWIILLLAKLTGRQAIAWSHGWYGKERGIRKILKKWYFSLFSKLMLYSEYSIHLMANLGFDKDKMFCIANSLDSDKELELRETLRATDIYSSHFGNDNPTVIYCGRLQKSKKIEHLIDAVAQMKSEGKPLNLVIIGKDIEHVNIQSYALRKGFDNIWMYGPCYEDEKLGELFYNAVVCVSPGNVGLTAIHSLTFGCPVITHNNFPQQMPEFEAIHPGITGDFFEQDNVGDLMQKIEAWTYGCPPKRESITQSCYHEIDRKWNIHYQIEVIKEVINGQDKNS
ncbi:glycosyltransferase [Prevotella sp. KH2C16]|uniref:glycosyltransferase n=1 Tax=Prevotella sp. KH2C16 TaxID=1855325 RepID=UPI0008E56AD4|nr:glycosyltransferase [Prevotella sp. KH2C16]SFG62149.1 Glycosyltransferase involved in cell wall bisynthesis [Prevotella sp. KH2C16]